jgi:hypothetical protein
MAACPVPYLDACAPILTVLLNRVPCMGLDAFRLVRCRSARLAAFGRVAALRARALERLTTLLVPA